MIKTDSSQLHRKDSQLTTFFALPTVLYGLNFGALGAVSNVLLDIKVFGDFSLYFGQIFVLFYLVIRGLNGAIIAVVLTSVTAAICANDPYLIVIYMLEVLIVHMSMRKGYFLFQSALTFWLMIGIPLLFFLHLLTSFTSIEFLFVSSVTRGLNGLICVSLVAIFCWFLPSNYVYKKYYTKPPQFSYLIFSLCMLTVTLPALVVSLFFIWQSSSHNEDATAYELNSQSLQLAQINNIEIHRHLDSLQTIATVLESNSNAKLLALLNATVANYDLFENMLISDKFGKVIFAAPVNYSKTLRFSNALSMHSKAYFETAQQSKSGFITNAIVGKTQDQENTIAFVVPIIKNNQFNGLVQATMLLETFTAFNNINLAQGYSYVVNDEYGRVIARSKDLDVDLPFLSNFDFKKYRNPLIAKVPAMTFKQQQYLYQQSHTKNGWTITILQSPNLVISMLIKYFYGLILATIFVLAVFALIAKSLSTRITKPLVNIAENFPNSKFHPQLIRESQVSSEMVKLTQKLVDSHEVMSNFHQQLSEQVHNKTKQLKQLNKELYSIAQKDSLTQLLNRAGFNRLAISAYRNCLRNHINLSLIFIDIDHFKKINDSHGHPFGDKCIIAVAKTIQKHCKRDTDIIGRYGGEEFIIMIVGGETSEHKERVALIKDEISELKFKKESNTIRMTISAGICSLENDFSIDYEDLLQLSDNQLYISKREGRNRISTIAH